MLFIRATASERCLHYLNCLHYDALVCLEVSAPNTGAWLLLLSSQKRGKPQALHSLMLQIFTATAFCTREGLMTFDRDIGVGFCNRDRTSICEHRCRSANVVTKVIRVLARVRARTLFQLTAEKPPYDSRNA